MGSENASLISLIEEERQKPIPGSWPLTYAEGYDDALVQVLEWLGVEE